MMTPFEIAEIVRQNLLNPWSIEDLIKFQEDNMEWSINRTDQMLAALEKKESMYHVIATVIACTSDDHPQIPLDIYFSFISLGMCLVSEERKRNDPQ